MRLQSIPAAKITLTSAMPKRKRANTPSPTESASAFTVTAKTQEKKFPFFDLPAELRINIYEKALEDDGVRLLTKPKSFHRKKQRKIWQNSLRVPRSVATFLLLNKQIHDEFMHIAATAAPIRTKPVSLTQENFSSLTFRRVLDFNFSYLITFLSRLGETDLKKLASDKSKLQIVIELDFCSGS